MGRDAGLWHNLQLPIDHLSIVPFPENTKVQIEFFSRLFRLLEQSRRHLV
jgi:hypothetical protein